MAFTLSEGLDGPATVTLSLASGDPADLGGFTSRTVDIPAGATSFVVEIPITDDVLREGNESFGFVLSDAQGNEPDGINLDRTTFSLVVIDNDGAGGGPGGSTTPVVVTTPPRDLDGDGEEDGGPQYLAVPVDGLTAADIAAAAAGDGPAPTVYVLDPATGRLVAADPNVTLAAGQPVYVDVAPGADLAFEGDAPGGVVPFEPAAGAEADDGRVVVAVGNPFADPVRLSDLVVEGGTLADVVLVLNPATGAFEPVALSSLADGTDILAAYGTVLVQVIPDGDGDVRVTLRRDATDGSLDPAASAFVGDGCPRSLGDEVVVCVALGVGGDAPDERDRVAVRLRPAADDLRGQGLALDPYDGLDLDNPGETQLSLPGGAEGRTRLAALSTPFTADSVVTVPLSVRVDGPGLYTLTLPREVAAFGGQDLEVAVVDNGVLRVLTPDDPYVFEVAIGEDLTGRLALRIGSRFSVDTDDRPALADAVGQPFPNPTAGGAALAVSVSEPQPVRVAVYDALGRAVAVAFDGTVQPGAPARVALPTAGLAPGVYVVRVDGRTVREARRLTVAR